MNNSTTGISWDAAKMKIRDRYGRWFASCPRSSAGCRRSIQLVWRSYDSDWVKNSLVVLMLAFRKFTVHRSFIPKFRIWGRIFIYWYNLLLYLQSFRLHQFLTSLYGLTGRGLENTQSFGEVWVTRWLSVLSFQCPGIARIIPNCWTLLSSLIIRPQIRVTFQHLNHTGIVISPKSPAP